MPDYEPIDYRLRCHTKRTDLPPDVLRDICEAYETIQRLTKERDEARRSVCDIMEGGGWNTKEEIATERGWDCFDTPKPKVDKTLKGVIIDGGKAVPPKYEGLGDEHL